MEYHVFTTYPESPVKGYTPSNNPHYIGMCPSVEEVNEIAGEVFPDLIVSSRHQSKRCAEKFMREGLKETPFYKVYEKEEIA